MEIVRSAKRSHYDIVRSVKMFAVYNCSQCENVRSVKCSQCKLHCENVRSGLSLPVGKGSSGVENVRTMENVRSMKNVRSQKCSQCKMFAL